MTEPLARIRAYTWMCASLILFAMGPGIGGRSAAAQEPVASTVTGDKIRKIDPEQLRQIQILQQQRLEGLKVAPATTLHPAPRTTEPSVARPGSGTAETAVQIKNWYPTVLSGQQLAIQGKMALADEEYQSAVALATTPTLRSQTYLSWADSYNQASRQRGNEPEILARSAELYRAALPDLSGNLRLVGYNNYAAVLLRQRRPQEALEALHQIEPEMTAADAASRARYLYNVGRALEDDGQSLAAAARYREALATDGSYKSAARATTRLLLAQAPDRKVIAETATWLDELIVRGETELAADGLRQALGRADWATASGSSRLIPTALRQLTAESTDSDAFRRDWERIFASAARQGLTAAGYVTDEIAKTYAGDVTVRFVAPGEGVPVLFSELRSDEERIAGAAFVKMAGDDLYTGDDAAKALQRYAAAWSLDNRNVEAALAAAALLSGQGRELDPDQHILNSFIYALFEAKGKAYLGEDWEAILRFHTVLGNIYERLEIWGPRYDPRSALFQWSGALAAHQRLRVASPERIPYVPVLRAKLARALEEEGETSSAWHAYVAAAEDALNLQNVRLARGYVEAAERLTLRANPSSQDRRRLLKLQEML